MYRKRSKLLELGALRLVKLVSYAYEASISMIVKNYDVLHLQHTKPCVRRQVRIITHPSTDISVVESSLFK